MRGALLPCAHGFQFLENLLGRGHGVRHVDGRLSARGGAFGGGLLRGRLGLIVGLGAELRLWQRVLGRGLNALGRLGGFGHGSRCAGEDELLGRSVGRGANEEIVEAEAGEQLREHFAWGGWAVCAEDAVFAGRTLDLHSGAGGDRLQDLQKGGVVGVDGELAVFHLDGGGGWRLICEGDGGLWRGRFLQDGRGRFLQLRGADGSGPKDACKKCTGYCESAPRVRMHGCGGVARSRCFAMVLHHE